LEHNIHPIVGGIKGLVREGAVRSIGVNTIWPRERTVGVGRSAGGGVQRRIVPAYAGEIIGISAVVADKRVVRRDVNRE
jgi:hypothetical protein